MQHKISKRLAEIIAALPLKEGIRVLEIGCGTGAAARAIAQQFNSIYILGIDRSATAIQKAKPGSRAEITQGKLEFRKIAIEDFESSEPLFDLAFAIRVGALDGRHPELEQNALTNIARALKPKGKLFIDGGDPLKEIDLKKYR